MMLVLRPILLCPESAGYRPGCTSISVSILRREMRVSTGFIAANAAERTSVRISEVMLPPVFAWLHLALSGIWSFLWDGTAIIRWFPEPVSD